jgi:hypothetical protein
VLFPNEESEVGSLSVEGRRHYAALRDFYATAPQDYQIMRVTGSIKTEELEVHDFAVLDDQCLAVTQSVVEEAKIDETSGKESLIKAARINGYLSWRTADVNFYADLFGKLWESSTSMPPAPNDHTIA